MLGDAKRPRRDRTRLITRAIARGIGFVAQVGADNADRVVHGEGQRDRAPFAVLVQHQLRFGRTAASQRRQQHEPPVVFVTGEQLPTTFLLVVVAPHPIAAGVLSGKESRRLMQRDHLLAFGRRIACQMPDRLRRLVGAGRVLKPVVVVINGRAALHIAVAVGDRFPCALAAAGDFGDARLPLPGQLKDGQAGTISESHISPLPTAARFFPENANRPVRNAAEEFHLARHCFAEAICLLNDIDLDRRHACDHRFADHVRRQVIFQYHELATVSFGGDAPPEDDFVLKGVEVRGRIMHRFIEAQYPHPRLMLPRFVLHLHDHGGLIEQLAVKVFAQAGRTVGARRVDEGVPVFRGRVKTLPGPDFFQVGHGRHPNPKRD